MLRLFFNAMESGFMRKCSTKLECRGEVQLMAIETFPKYPRKHSKSQNLLKSCRDPQFNYLR